MRFFAFNEGFIKPFRIKNTDGTDKDLTGLTIAWHFTDRAGDVPTGSPITGTITVALQGQVEFTVPSGLFIEETRYTSQINLVDGVSFDEDTIPFTVDIDNPRNRTT